MYLCIFMIVPPVVHENECEIMWIICVLDFIYVYTYSVVMYIVCFILWFL